MRGKNMNVQSKVVHSPSTSYNFCFVFFVILFAGTLALLNNNKTRPLLKFCFNSRDQFVQAQCVLCDYYQFSATVLGCNGRTTALLSNITSTEAVCIISNCLQTIGLIHNRPARQVRQAQPQFTGRRRRDASEDETTAPSKFEISPADDFDRQEIIDEKKELAAVSPSMKEFLSRYVMMDDKLLKELEDRVVDRIEVNVDEEDDDYDP